MTRFPWFPLFLLALAVCLLVAYARIEREADCEWQETCARIEREMAR